MEDAGRSLPAHTVPQTYTCVYTGAPFAWYSLGCIYCSTYATATVAPEVMVAVLYHLQLARPGFQPTLRSGPGPVPRVG
jgi:hypothetical protein